MPEKKVKKTPKVQANDLVSNEIFEQIEAYFKAIGFDPKQIALKSDLDALKSDVGTLKSDVGTLKSDVGSLKKGQAELLRIIFALRDDMNQKIDQKMDRILTILDGLVVKDMQDMKQEDAMHTARLDRHEAALADHDERIGHLEAAL